MSEKIKRYRFKGAAGEYVYANDFEAAQSELAALREELATANGCLEEWRRSKLGTTLLENTNLQQRLADAERRNAAALDILSRFVKLQLSDYEVRGGMSTRWQPLINEAQAALIKPEEAKS